MSIPEKINFHVPKVAYGSLSDCSGESSCWLGRQVCSRHPYLSIGIVVLIGLVVFAILGGLALGGVMGGGLPLVIGVAAGAAALCALGGGAAAWVKSRNGRHSAPVDDAEPSVLGISEEWKLEDFKGGNAQQRLSEKQVACILKRQPLSQGDAKRIYPVNNKNLVLIQAKPGQERKLDKEILRIEQIHKAVATKIAEGDEEEIMLAIDYVPVAGHQGLYLAKRYVGGDLDRFLNGGLGSKLTSEDALQLIGDMLTGLQQLHAVNYAHGDIKPENILVRLDSNKKRYVAMINDFGETRNMNKGPAVLHGNWKYSAPEQRVHLPSDVYALGLVAIRVLEQSLDIGGDSSESIERCFPVQDKGVLAFMKTGIARLGGIFGCIVYPSEKKIHDHIENQLMPKLEKCLSNQQYDLSYLSKMLEKMTLDHPVADEALQQRATIQEAQENYSQIKK